MFSLSLSHNMKRARPLWVTDCKQTHSQCAICRCPLSDRCPHCANLFDNWKTRSKHVIHNLMRKNWIMLLLLYRRTGTLFSKLDIHIISIIYGFTISVHTTTRICPLASLACGHIYHNHCFEKWHVKRPVCPLDNVNVDKFNIIRVTYD